MATMALLLLVFALVASVSSLDFSFPMSPALIWSNLRCSSSEQHRVDYQISSPQSVTEGALQQFVSIRKQCSDAAQKSPDMLVAFVGSEVRSMDLPNEFPSDTVDTLKKLVSDSTLSLAFPYVATTDGSSIASTLVHILEENKGIVGEATTIGCAGGTSLPSFLDVEDLIASKKESHLLLICLPSTSESEGKLIMNTLSKLEGAGIDYVALYASDPFGAGHQHALLHRQLAAMTNGSSSTNGTTNSTPSSNPFCNEVCQTKATLLEAIFVVIVLLIILISGLCCMMGIQGPIRFDKPHES